MTHNPSYLFIQKLAFHLCKAVFWWVFLMYGFSLGQLFVSDSTTLTIEEGEGLFEEAIEDKETKVFISKGTSVTNFPIEGDFVVIDKNQVAESQTLDPLKASLKKPVEIVEPVRIKNEIEEFKRIEKSDNRTFFSKNRTQIVGLAQNHLFSKDKNIATHPKYDLTFISFLKSSIFNTQSFSFRDNYSYYSLFARPPPFF